MPIVDLPLAQLQEYPGRNPRPGDHEEFWAQAVEELRQVEPDVRIEAVPHPATYAECFDLTFTGVRGARVYAKYARPEQAPREERPGVALFHGYTGAGPAWFELLPYVAQGYSVVAMDCRGQGGRSQDVGGVSGTTVSGHIVRGLSGHPRDLLFRQIFLDAVQVTRLLMDFSEVDAERVGVVGASQGGALALATAALEPRVKAAVSVYPFLCDYLRVWEMDLTNEAYAEIREYLRRFDPTHEQVTAMFTRLGYIDVQHLAPRIMGDVLMATGLMDTVCPPSTQFAAYNKITSGKQHVIYPDFGHEDLPGMADRGLAFFADRLEVDAGRLAQMDG